MFNDFISRTKQITKWLLMTVSSMLPSRSILSIPILDAFPSTYTIMFWVLVTIGIVATIVIVVAVIIRTAYRIGFYGKQPFKTKYDIFGKFFIGDNIVINTNSPEWSKFCDVTYTTIVNGDNLTDETIDSIHDAINSNTINTNTININTNTNTNKLELFKKAMVITREPSYVVINRKKGTTIETQGPIMCVMTATPISITFNYTAKRNTGSDSGDSKGYEKSKTSSLPAYSVEFNVMNSDGHNSQPFQISYATLHYFQQSSTPLAKVSLFKTKGLVWNVVPLCIIKSYIYKIDRELDYKFNITKELRFFEAKSENIRTAIDFIDDVTRVTGFETVITKELGDLLGLIQNKVIVIIGCVLRGDIVGVMFFKDISWTVCNEIYMSKNGESKSEKTMELLGSVFDYGIGDNIIQACFSRGLVLANRILKASFLVIGNTSHNNILIDVINKKGKKSISETTNGLYIRNYRTQTRPSEKCLIVV